MVTKEFIQRRMEQLKAQFGEWSYDIPLPYEVWTRGNQGIPHTRLKRIVQIAHDLCSKPLAECRVLDLGCLDGMFAIEFALHGSTTVGIEVREASIRKAIFCKEVLALDNLTFRQDDVRRISEITDGKFDIIICSGILYHLTAEDAFKLLGTLFSMTTRVVIIDTHIALRARKKKVLGGNEYYGDTYREHRASASQEQKSRELWASWDNPTSFWFTRPSLINLLSRAGFSSVYECFIPAHLNFGKPGVQSVDRCTFVAIKARTSKLLTSPAANNLRESWPEGSLFYFGRFRKLSRLLNKIRTGLGRRWVNAQNKRNFFYPLG